MKLTNLILSNDQSTVIRILVLCGVAWLPLAVLSFFDGTLLGTDVTIPFLKDAVPYVRGLIVIPLLVIADNVIEPVIVRILKYLETSGVVPESEHLRLNDVVERMAALLNSNRVQMMLVLLAVVFSWLLQSDYAAMWSEKGISSWMLHQENGEVKETLAGIWFLLVTSPLVSFLLYRWLWRFIVWSSFLYRISRIKLDLYASHSDLAGGLGMIGRGHCIFGIIFFIFAVMLSSDLASDMLYEGGKLLDVKQLVFVFTLISITVLLMPLLFFSQQLYELKQNALTEYSTLQHQISNDFHNHWIKDGANRMVDSMQPSAIADYGGVFETVSQMRMVPIDTKILIVLAVMLSIPFMPLLLIESSIWEVLKTIGGSMV